MTGSEAKAAAEIARQVSLLGNEMGCCPSMADIEIVAEKIILHTQPEPPATLRDVVKTMVETQWHNLNTQDRMIHHILSAVEPVVAKLTAAARQVVGAIPDCEIELMYECLGNTNTRIIRDAVHNLRATIGGDDG